MPELYDKGWRRSGVVEPDPDDVDFVPPVDDDISNWGVSPEKLAELQRQYMA